MAWYLHEPDDDEFKFVGKGRGNRTLRSGVTPRALATPPLASARVLDGSFPASVAAEVDSEAASAKFASAVLARVEELRGLKLCATLHEVLFAFLSRFFGPGAASLPAKSDRCSCPEVDVVGYGLGTTAFGTNTPIQLAALVLIASEIRKLLPKFACGACRAKYDPASGMADAAAPAPGVEASPAAVDGRVHVAAFDPLTSPTDAALLRRLGIAVIETNEGCRRPARLAPSCGGRCTAALAAAGSGIESAAAGTREAAAASSPSRSTTVTGASAVGGCGLSGESGAAATAPSTSSSSSSSSAAGGCACACPKRIVPLIAFMPHCDAPLYGALLTANLDLALAPSSALSADEIPAAVGDGSMSGSPASGDLIEASSAASLPLAPRTSAMPATGESLPLRLLPHVCLVGNSLSWYARSHSLSAGSRAGDASKARSKRRGKGHSSCDSSASPVPSPEEEVRSAASLVASGGEPDPARVFAAFAASCTVLDAAALSAAAIKEAGHDLRALTAVEVPFPLGDAEVLVERALDATSFHLFLD